MQRHINGPTVSQGYKAENSNTTCNTTGSLLELGVFDESNNEVPSAVGVNRKEGCSCVINPHTLSVRIQPLWHAQNFWQQCAMVCAWKRVLGGKDNLSQNDLTNHGGGAGSR